MRCILACVLTIFLGQNVYSLPRNLRYSTHLSVRDQEFAKQLSRRHKKIFCGQFNQAQREKAVRYAIQGVKKPDEAVMRVMEETGMPLATKRKSESEEY